MKDYDILDDEYNDKNGIIGETFSYLTIHKVVKVLCKTNNIKKWMAVVTCKCSPDVYRLVPIYQIINGNTKSCGCYKSSMTRERNPIIHNKSKKYFGKKYITNQGYTVQVICCKDTHNITIKFLNTLPGEEYETTTSIQNIKKGQVMYPYHRNKWGGYYGVGPYTSRINGEKTKVYKTWIGILDRCYTKPKNKKSSSYYGKVKVCDEWLNFQNFAEWYTKNYYEIAESLDIDKDLLSIYYKLKQRVYSPKTCILMPESINRKLNYIDVFDYNKFIEINKYIETYKGIIPDNIYTKIINTIKCLAERVMNNM